MGQYAGEWDERQKIGWSRPIEDQSKQQRPETDKQKRDPTLVRIK